MLWSQIKLTPYDFSDLQITGDFDNRPGTGHFLKIFSCVVTNHMGAGRRLYMIASAYTRPGIVRCRRCKRSNLEFEMKQFFTYNDVYTNINIRQRLLKKRKNEADTDSDGGENIQ